MAYPTVSGPYGLVPVKMVNGNPYNGATRAYKIASNYGTAIFNGDAVTIHTDGTVIRDVADAAMEPIGVFVGCSYTDPTYGLTFRNYYPGSITASDITAYVVDDPNVLFKVAVVSSAANTTPIVIADLSQADVGRNATMVNNTGDTTTGRSRIAIDDTTANTATLPIRIVALVEETKNASGGYTEALVKWNAGHQLNNTTGQGS